LIARADEVIEKGDVRYWHKADMPLACLDVRYWG
jgi:hypothetical protein